MTINKKTHQKWSVQALLHTHTHTRTHTHKKKLNRSKKKKNQFQNITSETPGKMWHIAAIFFFFFHFCPEPDENYNQYKIFNLVIVTSSKVHPCSLHERFQSTAKKAQNKRFCNKIMRIYGLSTEKCKN